MPDSYPDAIPTLQQQLSQGGYAALLTDHCQLVEQFENLVVVVIQLWEMNNAQREALTLLGRPLPRQPLPIAASLACAARTVALMGPRAAGTVVEKDDIGVEEKLLFEMF